MEGCFSNVQSMVSTKHFDLVQWNLVKINWVLSSSCFTNESFYYCLIFCNDIFFSKDLVIGTQKTKGQNIGLATPRSSQLGQDTFSDQCSL